MELKKGWRVLCYSFRGHSSYGILKWLTCSIRWKEYLILAITLPTKAAMTWTLEEKVLHSAAVASNVYSKYS